MQNVAAAVRHNKIQKTQKPLIRKFYLRDILIVFLPINMCFGCWEDFQLSGPQFIYRIMHSFKYGGYRPYTPVEMLIVVIFCFFSFFLNQHASTLIATVDMRKGILPGTAILDTSRVLKRIIETVLLSTHNICFG